jgi:DNA-3-methyladenine glycosylase I|tara:strand:+ start:65 stop:640 length:576 start_codon:yes stop_codon:yes gene_type:complete
MNRCEWPGADELMLAYHDEEWGVPVQNDQKWFEFMVLDTFQAGLSWRIVLNKREGFRNAFANFEVEKVSQFTPAQMEKLREDKSIIRNKLKIKATVTNAQAFVCVQEEFGSFNKYIWDFVGGKPIANQFKTMNEVPAKTDLSDALSKDLYARGFKFVGSTICYAFMQAAGLVNDHRIGCYRHQEITSLYAS